MEKGDKCKNSNSPDLYQQFLHNLTAYIREAEVAALELVGQAGVVQTEQMQNRGFQVVDVDLVFHNVVAELVGGAQRDSFFDARPLSAPLPMPPVLCLP